MALIKCPECGKEISDRCISCPNCGFPLNESVSIPPAIDKSKEIEKYLGLAVNGIQAENPEQVEKYCELVLEMLVKTNIKIFLHLHHRNIFIKPS